MSKDYWEYEGEELCPRCGGNEMGEQYKVCVEYKALTDAHKLSCERYRYGDLCERCEVEPA